VRGRGGKKSEAARKLYTDSSGNDGLGKNSKTFVLRRGAGMVFGKRLGAQAGSFDKYRGGCTLHPQRWTAGDMTLTALTYAESSELQAQ